mmetsp:Transcript_98837/g.258187  ORF Transcript_98837/g.258187 Transcript_98837/m.258187 type:complete len:357 (+) Transcript_98837:73-1143(+)
MAMRQRAVTFGGEPRLPTLLTSRPCGQRPGSPAKCEEKACALELEREPGVAAPPWGAVEQCLSVRNTFVDFAAQRSPSLERFFRERKVRSCPASPVDDRAFGERTGRLMGQPPGAASPSCSCEERGDADLTWRFDALTRCPSFDSGDEASPPFAAPPFCFEVGGCSPAAPAAGAMCTSPMGFGGMCHAGVPSPAVPQPCTPSGTMQAVLSLADAISAPPVSSAYSSASGTPVGTPTAFSLSGLVASACRRDEFGFAHAAPVPLPCEPPCIAPGSLALAASSAPPPAPAAAPSGPSVAELPSMGSHCHFDGTCKPCAFFHTAGCANGASCQFCHLCGPEERKQRKAQRRKPFGTTGN